MKEAPCPDCAKELTHQEPEYMDGFLYIQELYYCETCDIIFDPIEFDKELLF